MKPDLSYVPQFGLYHLSLDQAGLLVAKCLWFRGDIDIDFQRDGAVDFQDRGLEAALQGQATKFTKLLIIAAQSNSLRCAQKKFCIKEHIQPGGTYVEAFTLASWLEQRDIFLGDVFEDEYLAGEAELADRVSDLIGAERFHQDRSKVASGEGAELIFLRHQVAELTEQLNTAKVKEPRITEKQKSSYLNIIGALLGLLLGKSSTGQPYSKFMNQQAIIDGIHANFGEAHGLSMRNLQDKFARAKRYLKHLE